MKCLAPDDVQVSSGAQGFFAYVRAPAPPLVAGSSCADWLAGSLPGLATSFLISRRGAPEGGSWSFIEASVFR